MRATANNERKEALQVRVAVSMLERLRVYARLKDKREREVVAESLDQYLPPLADIRRLESQHKQLAEELETLQPGPQAS